jgi:hypothetical protein
MMVREWVREVSGRLVSPRLRARIERGLPLARHGARVVREYRRRLLADVANFAFASVVVMALYTATLYGLGLWWTVFRETAVGERFFEFFVERATAIETFLDQPLWRVTGRTYLVAAAAGLAVGAVGQLLLLKRYLYDFAGWPTRIAIWGGATLLGTSLWAAEAFSVPLQAALILCALPALGMFAQCLALAARLCPEATTLGRLIARSGAWRRLMRRWPWRR